MRSALHAALLLGVATVTHAQAVVYENTTTYTGTENVLLAAGQNDSTEHGDEVTLGGVNRAVTRIDVLLRIQGAGPATFDARVRFYANDGPGGRPGTVLWTGPLTPGIIDSGAPLQYGFPVPGIVVPDTFTWTVEVSNRSGNTSELGPSLFDPPTTGSAPFGFWRRTGPGPTDWEFTGPGEAPFGARIEAVLQTKVPGPGGAWSTVLAGSLAGLGLWKLRRRRSGAVPR